MRTVLFTLMSFLTFTAMAQSKGKFEVHDFGTFKLHVYYTNDALGDASYIIEGKTELVTMEQPLFKENVAEFDTYLEKIAKPVEQRIANYHVGGTGSHDIVMAEGMKEFSKGAVYGGMIQNFQNIFGDALTELPDGEISEAAFGRTYTWAGIGFEFRHGASTDFPAASIVIEGKVYYTHWTPAKAHAGHLQISSRAAIDAEISEAENGLKSGCLLFIGGHGGAAGIDAVQFKIDYLKTVKRLLAENKTADAFITALKTAYPDLPGEAGLEDLAKVLYQ